MTRIALSRLKHLLSRGHPRPRLSVMALLWGMVYCTVPVFAAVESNLTQFVKVKFDRSLSQTEYYVRPQELFIKHNVPSRNFVIKGTIQVHPAALSDSVYIMVNTTDLPLRQGNRFMVVHWRGSIGNESPSTSPIQVNYIGGQAPIDLVGDLDESTMGLWVPPGSYHGSLIITASFF